MRYIVAGCTDVGTTKNTNQDSYSVRMANTNIGKIVLAVLCDGMGGLDKGELASATLVNAFNRWFAERLPHLISTNISDATITREWNNLLTDYNEKIKLYGKKAASKLGTTVTAMLIMERKYYIINVGDTRAYEITHELIQITKDQTVVAKDMAEGNITAEEAEHDVRRSVLLQCIGASDNIFPEIFIGTTKKEAVYMLCSDGFRHEVTGDEIFEGLKPEIMTSQEMMQSNVQKLIDLNKQRMETDNITAVAIRTL